MPVTLLAYFMLCCRRVAAPRRAMAMPRRLRLWRRRAALIAPIRYARHTLIDADAAMPYAARLLMPPPPPMMPCRRRYCRCYATMVLF